MRPGRETWLAAAGAVAVTAVLATVLHLARARLGSSSARGAEPEPSTPDSAEVVAPRAGQAPEGRRVSAASPAGEVASEASEPAGPATPFAPETMRGRVLDLDGAPVGGVAVSRTGPAGPTDLAVTSGDGRFEISLQDAWVGLRVETDAWTTVRSGRARADGATRDLLIVIAPVIALEGRVADELGAPVPGASVSIHVDKEDLTGFPLPLDGTENVTRSPCQTDAGGTFAFERAPAVPSGTLRAEAPGFEEGRVPLPDAPAFDLEIALARPAPLPAARTLAGVVLVPGGTPAAGAVVRLGDARAETGADGRFQLALPESSAGDLLVAWKTGFLPAYMAAPDLGGGDPAPVVLLLGGTPLEIAGRVLGPGGEPAVGWHVQLADGTRVGADQIPILWAESPQGWAGVDADTGRQKLVTDADGGFRVGGLFPRDYRLELWDPETLAMHTSEPIAAGTQNARIELPADLWRERIGGRVTSRRGRPLAGVAVQLALVTARSQHGYVWESGTSVRTDAAGRFELEHVPARRAHLAVSGDDVIPEQRFFDDGFPEGPIEIEVALRCHFKIEGLDPGHDNSLQMLDATGEPLTMYSFSAGGSWSSSRARLGPHESSPVLATSEDAVTAVLYVDGKESARQALDLVPGEVTVLRFEEPGGTSR